MVVKEVLEEITDPWVAIGKRLGKRAGQEFLRRYLATKNGEVSLHVLRQRDVDVKKWVAPPESIDDEPAQGAQSV